MTWTKLDRGIHMWRATHPEWHRTTELVASYCLSTRGAAAIVDPLLPKAGADDVVERLDGQIGSRDAVIHITIPYHVRSANELARMLDIPVCGHPGLQRRLERGVQFCNALDPGSLPTGFAVQQIGNPVRNELLLWCEPLRALVVGDSIVGVNSGLRVWANIEEAKRRFWYEHRFLPTLEPLGQLGVDHVLVTHGEPVIGTGGDAIAAMLAADPIAFTSKDLAGSAVP
jgi:hypothetical protein